jgi:hypothetical protein
MKLVFKPSQVDLFGSFPPLVGTFDKTEAEVMAAFMCRAMGANGDEWRAIEWREIATVLKSDIAAGADGAAGGLPGLMTALLGNPFARPDVHALVKGGFVAWVGAEGGPVEFTDLGFARLEKWVRLPRVMTP